MASTTMSDHENSEHNTDDSTSAEFDVHEDDVANVEAPLAKDISSSLNEIASRLCSTCREFLRGEIKEAAYRIYHPSLTALKKSVDAGCCICKDLSQSLDLFCENLQPPAAPSETCSIQCAMAEHLHSRKPKDISASKNALVLWFQLQESDCPYSVKNSHEAFTFTTMYFFPVDGLSLGSEFLDPKVEKTTAKSAASMSLARHWYQQCLTHSTCRNWRQHSRQIPTRLIRVRRPDSNYPDIISAQLCEAEDLAPDIVYATLSHLWGDNQIFQLRKGNIEQLKQSIPFHQLPQVFQDAIYVSIELGIEYLWIDSLCIIQDSKEDWTYEAKRMGNVYQYATCNIAAAGYKDSSLSLFADRKVLSEIHPPVFADCTLKNDWGKALRLNGLYIRADDDAFYHEIVRGILNSRAWVSQERALSPGILHFTPEMMWWECSDLVANEAFPTGHIVEDSLDFKPCTIRSLAQGSDPETVYEFWRKFISLYAGKALTYEQDRFPAAVGIARTLSELIDDNFIAGFWEGDLIRSLIMEPLGTVEDLPLTPRAPSWSWASLCANYRGPLMSEPTPVRPLRGVSIRVLSDLPAFKSDLDSTSLELSGVKGLEITAPLRKFSPDMMVGLDDDPEWLQSAEAVHDLVTSHAHSHAQIPVHEAWRLCDPTHFLVLAKMDWEFHPGVLKAWALLIRQSSEAEDRNTFRKQGLVHFYFRSEEKMEEYLGLKEDEGQLVLSPVLGECGFQKIILI